MDKRALCIGINDYPGAGRELTGCVNDANDWAAMLGGRGFTVSRLVDAEATWEGIVSAVQDAVAGAAKGDVLVVTYSGFGTYVPDPERFGADLREALCPTDVAQGRLLLLDELDALLNQRATGSLAVVISDTCHAGTVTRGDDQSFDPGTARMRILPPQVWMDARRAHHENFFEDLPQRKAEGLGDLLVTACHGYEFGWEGRFAGRASGVFTYHALKALASLQAGASYEAWARAIQSFLPSSRWTQSPRFVGTAKMMHKVALG